MPTADLHAPAWVRLPDGARYGSVSVVQEATLPMKVRMCGDAFMPVVGGRWTMVCRHLPDGRWSDEEERLSSSVRAAAGARRGYMRQMQRPTLGKGHTLGKGSSGASLLNSDTTTSVKLGQTKDIGAAALASWWWLLGFMSVWTGSGQIRAATWVATQWPGRWSKVGWHPIHALAPLQPGVEYWLVRLSEDHKNGDWRIFSIPE